MRYIVRSFKPNKGVSNDKATGQEFAWDKMDIQCEVKDDRTSAVQPIGENWREVISVKNDFNSVVLTNSHEVKHFANLIGCEIVPFYNRWGKIETISVVSQNAEF